MENQVESSLIVGPDDPVPAGEATLLGLQHVLAMDVYVPPIILAGMMAMGAADSTGLLQSTFLAAGIGTILQTCFFMKMPVSQGPSFVPLGAAAGVVMASGGLKGNGMATLLGALVVGAIVLVLLGLSGAFQKIINTLVPAVVGGTIITCVGLSLIPSALNDNIFEATGNIYQNIELASITALTLLICVAISIRFPRVQKLFKTGSIVIALLVGTLVSASMGRFDWKSVADSAWFSFPQRTMLHWGISFNLTSILTFIIIYAILTTETTGTWFAMGQPQDYESPVEPRDHRRRTLLFSSRPGRNDAGNWLLDQRRGDLHHRGRLQAGLHRRRELVYRLGLLRQVVRLLGGNSGAGNRGGLCDHHRDDHAQRVERHSSATNRRIRPVHHRLTDHFDLGPGPLAKQGNQRGPTNDPILTGVTDRGSGDHGDCLEPLYAVTAQQVSLT